MDPTLQALLYGLLTNAAILLVSFLIFLYIRWLRGDRTRGSVAVLRTSSAPLIGPVPPGIAHRRGRFLSASSRQVFGSFDISPVSAVTRHVSIGGDDPSRTVLYRTYTMDVDGSFGCGFAGTVWRISVDQFFSMDIQFYLEFVKSAAKISWILSLIGCGVVLPINLTAPAPEGVKQSWLDRASAGNITANGRRIWVLYATTWVYSAVVYYFALCFWRRLRKYRIAPTEHFTTEKFALMVRGLKHDCTDSTPLREHFEALQPGKVVSARLVLDYSTLIAAKKKLIEYGKDLDKRLEEEHRQSATRTRPSVFCISDDEVSAHQKQLSRDLLADDIGADYKAAVEDMTGGSRIVKCGSQHSASLAEPSTQGSRSRRVSELQNLESQFLEQRAFVSRTAMLEPTRNVGIGFVTFTSTSAAAECICDPRVLGTNFDWEVKRAPPSGDIIWSNIHIPPHVRTLRILSLNTLLFIFSIIITSSALLTNWVLPLVDNFEKAVDESDIFKISMTGWGPPLILFVVNSLILPFCVWWTATSAGHWRESSQAAAILHGNAVFLVLNSLIFPIVGTGSIWAVINRMYHTEIQSWNIQMSALIVTQSGSFAVKYLLNACFLSSSANLLQIPQFTYRKVVEWFGKSEPPWAFDFGYHYAFCTSIFTLCLVLSVFLPLVLPLAGLFFLFKYWLDKYNFAYTVWTVDVDSAGAVTRTALNYMISAVIFMQFGMSGYFLKFGLGYDRYLTLGGTLLFLASTVGLILQLGQFVNIGSFVQDWKPDSCDRERYARDAELDFLKQAYMHPCSKPLRRSSSFDELTEFSDLHHHRTQRHSDPDDPFRSQRLD